MTLADEDRALNSLVHADLVEVLPVVNLDYFADLFPARRDVAEYFRDYIDKTGLQPSTAQLRRKFKAQKLFTKPVKADPLVITIDELRNQLVEEVATSYSQKMSKNFEKGDVPKFIEIGTEMMACIEGIQRPVEQAGKSVSDLTAMQLARLDSDATLALKAIPTGFPPMDRELGGGASPGQLIVLAALINLGKTYALCQIAENMRAAGYRVLLVPLEMSAEAILERCVCLRYRLDVNQHIKKLQPQSSINAGESREDWYRKILQERQELENKDQCKGEVIVEVSPGLTTTRDIQNWARRHEVDAIIIDAAQDIMPSAKANGRVEGIYTALAELNNMTRLLEVPIIMSVQLGADVEKKGLKGNTLVHIQWSQAFAQKAHAVFTMLGDRQTCDRDMTTDKNRDGNVGLKWEIKMHFPEAHIEGTFLQAKGLVLEDDMYDNARAVIQELLSREEEDDDEEDRDCGGPAPAPPKPSLGQLRPEDHAGEDEEPPVYESTYLKERAKRQQKRLKRSAFRKRGR